MRHLSEKRVQFAARVVTISLLGAVVILVAGIVITALATYLE